MTSPRKLDPERTSLDELVEELFFTKLLVRNTPDAKAHVAAADKLHDDAKAQADKERALLEALLEAEVRIALGNRGLDGFVSGFRGVLNQRTGSDPGAPLYQRFFGKYRPSEVIRMALATELPVVEPWVASLLAESDPELLAQGKALEAVVKTGREALAAKSAARQALRDFAAGPRQDLFEQIQVGRTGLYAKLLELGQDVRFAESFFRPGPRQSSEAPPEPSVQEAAAELETRRKAVLFAEAQLVAAQQREAAAQAATAARAAQEAERDAKKKELEAVRLRLAELEDSLRS
jgi:hypothetical protein